MDAPWKAHITRKYVDIIILVWFPMFRDMTGNCICSIASRLCYLILNGKYFQKTNLYTQILLILISLPSGLPSNHAESIAPFRWPNVRSIETYQYLNDGLLAITASQISKYVSAVNKWNRVGKLYRITHFLPTMQVTYLYDINFGRTSYLLLQGLSERCNI